MGHCSVLQLQQPPMRLLLQLTITIITTMANTAITLAAVLLPMGLVVIMLRVRVRRQTGCSSCHLGSCQSLEARGHHCWGLAALIRTDGWHGAWQQWVAQPLR
jgi:hypothetical protein